MNSPSPYDLNATATDIRKKRERTNRSRSKRINQFQHSSDEPSPYDLSSHGGLASLAEKAREDPLLFR